MIILGREEITLTKEKSGLCPQLLGGDLQAPGMSCVFVYLGLGPQDSLAMWFATGAWRLWATRYRVRSPEGLQETEGQPRGSHTGQLWSSRENSGTAHADELPGWQCPVRTVTHRGRKEVMPSRTPLAEDNQSSATVPSWTLPHVSDSVWIFPVISCNCD